MDSQLQKELTKSKSSDLASSLRNFGQAASNSVAETVSAPIDAITWALRKAGMPIDKPVMGSDWMAEKGLTRPTQEGASKLAGEFVGMVSPLAFEKSVATQLAGALRNVKPSAGLSTEAVGGMGFLNPNSHRPMTIEQGAAPLHDLSSAFDDTIYSPAAIRNYGTGDALLDKQVLNVFKAAKGNPNAEISAYRAVPLDDAQNALRHGDWVSVSKDYAKVHGEGPLGGKYRIIEQKVPASHLTTNSDSILEQGYYPMVNK